MIKELKRYDVYTTPFTTAKSWTLFNTQNNDLVLVETTGSLETPISLDFVDYQFSEAAPILNRDCNIALEQQEEDIVLFEEGEKITGLFDVSESKNNTGTYKRLIYHQIKNSFYNNYNNPTQIFGLENLDFQTSKTRKFISDKFRVFNVPKLLFGEKIIPGTVQFIDNALDDNYIIKDDFFGNLIAKENLFSRVQEVRKFPNNIFTGSSDYSCPGVVEGSGESTPTLDMDITSESGSIILNWIQTETPTSNEVWRSQNGGSYSLLNTVSGAVTTYTDNDVIGSGDIWCYKVTGVPGGFSNEVCAVRDVLFGSGSVSNPTWVIAFGIFGSEDITLVETLNLSGLKRVTDTFYLDSAFIMTDLDLSSLTVVNSDFHLSLSTTLTNLNLPSLTTVQGNMYCDACSSLTNVTMSNFIFHEGQQLYFDSCGLNAASVNHLLARLVASNVTGSTLTLDGGTNSPPTGQGITDYSASVAAGNTVGIN
jgi:hypothetical protein